MGVKIEVEGVLAHSEGMNSEDESLRLDHFLNSVCLFRKHRDRL